MTYGKAGGRGPSHTGSERHFLELASFQQVLVLSSNDRVVACGDQGRHVEHTADIGPASLGLAVAAFLATIVVHGGNAHERCHLLAVHGSQFW